MKKNWLTLVTIFLATTSFAQQTNKHGDPYLPEAGDWGIGINANPFFKYVGNLFSDSETDGPEVLFPNENFAIQGKYFKSDSFAYRASLRFNVLADKQIAFSPEYSATPTNTTVEDAYSRAFTNFYLALGVEKRKGKSRLQGFYGAEAMLGFGTEKHSFDYGNDITNENTSPDRTDWTLDFQDFDQEVTSITDEGAFMTEYKFGSTFSIGARAFVGAEYFFLPKWSVGFELGLGAGFFYQGSGEVVTEQWTIPTGGTAEQYVTTVTDIGGSSAFRLDTDNTGGALYFNFYF